MYIFKQIVVILFFVPTVVFAQYSKLQLDKDIRSVINGIDGRVGVGVMELDSAYSLLINDSQQYPMLSVYKFPLAIYVLHLVDNGKLALEQKIEIDKSDLVQNTWSPMLKDFREQKITMTLADVLQYAVSKSDNNACDILFGLVGGTKAADKYFKKQKVDKISIAATEREMGEAWNVQYKNWCRPSAMLAILRLFYENKLLQPLTNNYLMKLMVESENSPKRLKGMLPENTIVAHKTGTGNTNTEGITSATNDVGLIALPNGKYYAIVVYIADYKGGIAVAEKAIANISKLVWEYYSSKAK